jgi:hypothetical protein
MGGVSNNYIPRSDDAFDAWSRQFREAITDLGPGLGIDPPTIGLIRHRITDWQAARAEHTAALAAAQAALAAKRDIRAALESLIRPTVRRMQAAPAITDAARATLGITVPGTPTLRVGSVTTRPIVDIAIPARLTHELRLRDERTPTRKALPRGVRGAEVWLALTPTPTTSPASMDDYRFLGLATRGELARTFAAADAGKTACYQIRWVSTRGEKGPWSEVARATVAA